MTEKKTAAKAPAKKTAAPKKTAGRKKAASVAEFDAKLIKELKRKKRPLPPKLKRLRKKSGAPVSSAIFRRLWARLLTLSLRMSTNCRTF